MEVINHFSHEEHPLILKELQEDDDLEKVDCYGCKQPVVSSGSTTYYYCCSECKLFLHKSCAELPLEINHPMHFEHPLQLLAKPHGGGYCVCNICYRSWAAFTYNCSKCEFDLDVLCAQLDVQATFKHPGHPHPLKHQRRSAEFICDACGVKEEDESYDCTVCSFWIHKNCGSMSSIMSFKYHPHPLSLAYGFPDQYRHYKLKCDICCDKLHPSHWVFYCGPCRDFFHLKCIISKSQEDEAAKANSNKNDEIPPNAIKLPVENLSSVLINLFLEHIGLPKLVEPLSEIQHPCHQHPLILTTIEDDYYEFTDDDQETVCSACIEPISGSCYTCAPCNFSIHVLCAHYLPYSLSSSLHPEHKLSLSYFKDCFHYSLCSRCKSTCNGFLYRCVNCKFVLDIKCALLPTTIKHEDHDHLLFQFQGESYRALCNACSYIHKDNFFRCRTCPYQLAMRCATLPKSVGHRWDKHPFILSFPPFDHHPDEFTCDMCGEEIHPKYWLYHCRECNNSFHPHCVPRLMKYLRNMKFGSKLQMDDHQHPLTFTREVNYKSSCHKCGEDMEGHYAAFVCETCYLVICYTCVRNIVYPSLKLSN